MQLTAVYLLGDDIWLQGSYFCQLSVLPLLLSLFNTVAAALWASSSPQFSSLLFPILIIAFYLIGSAPRILMLTEIGISSVLLLCLCMPPSGNLPLLLRKCICKYGLKPVSNLSLKAIYTSLLSY